MAKVILFLCIVAVANFVSETEAGAFELIQEKIKGAFNKCGKEFDVDLKNLHDITETNPCFLACLLKQSESLDKGRVMMSKVEGYLGGQVKEMDKDKKLQSIKECAEEIGTFGDGDEGCKNSKEFFMCVKNKLM